MTLKKTYRIFNNMLVVCATYFNAELRWLVDRLRLQKQLDSTCAMLEGLARVSTMCKDDHVILSGVRSVVFDRGA